MLMTFKAEVIRGWPNDGARDNYETLASSVTAINGDWVVATTGNAVTNLGVTSGIGVGAGAGTRNAGLVLKGNGDIATGGSAGATNKAVVIWGNAIVRVDSSTLASGYSSPAVGDSVTIRGTNGGKFQIDKAATTDQIIGFVKEVNSAVAGQTTANVVVVLF